MKKPASAFAPAMAGGRTIAWEALGVFFTPQPLDVAFPVTSNVAAGITTRFQSLLPENVTRGTVTLERIRGRFFTLWDTAIIAAVNGEQMLAVPYLIQLVPIQDGTIALDSVLDGRNAADLESNRIIYRGTIYPNMPDASGALVDAVRHYSQETIIDIKSKRRFDRATWALIMSVSFDTVNEVKVRHGNSLRALFKSADGV